MGLTLGDDSFIAGLREAYGDGSGSGGFQQCVRDATPVIVAHAFLDEASDRLRNVDDLPQYIFSVAQLSGFGDLQAMLGRPTTHLSLVEVLLSSVEVPWHCVERAMRLLAKALEGSSEDSVLQECVALNFLGLSYEVNSRLVALRQKLKAAKDAFRRWKCVSQISFVLGRLRQVIKLLGEQMRRLRVTANAVCGDWHARYVLDVYNFLLVFDYLVYHPCLSFLLPRVAVLFY